MPGAIYTRPVTIDRGSNATAVDAATAVGIAVSQYFSIAAPLFDSGIQQAGYNVIAGGGGTITTLTADLEFSVDGGATWQVQQAAINLQSTPTGFFQTLAGRIYRFNIKTLVLGTATSVTVAVQS